MFKRIKNLLDLSRYTVEELKQPTPTYTTTGYAHVASKQPSPHYTVSTADSTSGMATIINMDPVDPFKDLTNETTEQTPDDTAPRN
jgi:hypothetical protein